MAEQFEDFFREIYGDTEGYVTINTKSESGKLDSERWFHVPNDIDYMSAYCAMRADEDVYCSVNIFSDKQRTKDDVNAVARVVYADLDTCNPDNLRLPPTRTVQTSPGRWHGWWVLDETVSAKDASDASHRIFKAHEKQGCDRGFAIGKLLRVPGTSNTKGETVEVVTADYTGVKYTLDTINAAYHDVDIAPQVKLNKNVPDIVSKEELLELEEVVARNNLTNLYLTVPEEGQSWSERAYKLELELFRAGLSAEEVFNVAREAACNKYAPDAAGKRTQTGVAIPRRSNPDLVLWQEVQKAYAEFESEEPLEVEPYTATKVTVNTEFLTVAERRWCQDNPSFIDWYVSWVAERTDSAPVYQYSMAYMLLACVFSARGYLPFEYGNTELNLWVMLLGPTTRGRKSTAKNLMMSVVHEYERQTGIKIDIGSDATAEALRVELAKREGTATIQHMDETHGWLASLYSKQYMAGVLEVLTELYDGHVPVVLRNSKDSGNKKRARAAFNYLGVGIRKRTAEVLTKSHFESGFLARMLWAVADPPPRKKYSENIRFRGAVRKQHTTYVSDIVEDLMARVSMWSVDTPSAIVMSKEAEARYNEWAEEGITRAEKYGDGEVLVPSFNRLAVSVCKSAALLAMYDQSEVIEIEHLLHAIKQSELWFRDMVRMANEVSSSEFERRCEEVLTFIANGPDKMRTETHIWRTFKRFRPRDRQEILEALKGSGQVRIAREKKGYIEALG